MVEKCEILLTKKPTVEINFIDKISRRDSGLLEKLKLSVITNIYNDFIGNKNLFSVEISNKDFDKYFQAHITILEFNFKRERRTIEVEGCCRSIFEILDHLRNEIQNCSLEEFTKIINSSNLHTLDENDIILTSDKLFNHFCTEVSLDGQTYFLMEKDWYIVKSTFLDLINKQAEDFLISKKYDGVTLYPWISGSENSYNKQYLNRSGWFVFDRFTPDNIEACDILQIDDDKIYFYHVKKGFDNSMRDLCNQVKIAGRKVFEDFKSDYSFMKSLYNEVKNTNGTTEYSLAAKAQFNQLKKTDFINLIKGKKVIFVLAVLDSAKKERDLFKEIEKFESNIAKFALIELVKNMNALGAEFQIAQLKNSI